MFVYEHYRKVNKKKKRRVAIISVFCLIVGILYLQFGRDVKVVSSMNSSSGDYYEMDLTVVANRLFIIDKEKFAEDLLHRCIANTFHEIQFSYDIMGYPDRLTVKVYLNKKNKPYFTIYYKSMFYNNPENNTDKFEIFIAKE